MEGRLPLHFDWIKSEFISILLHVASPSHPGRDSNAQLSLVSLLVHQNISSICFKSSLHSPLWFFSQHSSSWSPDRGIIHPTPKYFWRITSFRHLLRHRNPKKLKLQVKATFVQLGFPNKGVWGGVPHESCVQMQKQDGFVFTGVWNSRIRPPDPDGRS